MILEMLRWWYVTGWIQAAHRIGSWTAGVEQMFSLNLLLRTLFSPWKRIITAPGRGLDAQFRAGLDNLISRTVGFVIRLFVILAALFSMLGTLVASVIMVIVWPLLPLAVVGLVIKGIIG
jgi:hypothetical protein